MKDINDIYEKLEQVERFYGLFGVIIAIILIVLFILIWKYITKTVELQAKGTFDKELADYNKGIQEELSILNSEIGQITNRKTINTDKEREAILNYLNAYSYWLYGSLEIDILSFKYNNFEDINSILIKIREAHSECNQCWNKLKFWSDNEKIVNSSHELNLSLLKYSQYHEIALSNLRHNLSWGKIYTDQFQAIIDKMDKMKDWAEFLASEDKRIRDENDNIIKEYWKGRQELFIDVISKNNKFQAIAREYLRHE
ncbi:MAG: hypothetical protein EPN39_17500 [Chitinophagaceae bacterium]|nr:MAG: hypothetical protein EPN39_17500 [Chitinophagaceae bacterium]